MLQVSVEPARDQHHPRRKHVYYRQTTNRIMGQEDGVRYRKQQGYRKSLKEIVQEEVLHVISFLPPDVEGIEDT